MRKKGGDFYVCGQADGEHKEERQSVRAGPWPAAGDDTPVYKGYTWGGPGQGGAPV